MYILFLYERSLLLVFSFFSPFFRKSIANSKKSRIFAAQLRKTSCPDGGIGRRAGLKHQWIHFPGSGYIKTFIRASTIRTYEGF